MSFTELPPEILTSIVNYATIAAPTRQRRRKELLTLGKVNKALSTIALNSIYRKLAYEISLKGLKLLSTLNKGENGARYASMVRALAIRERESGVQRKPINSREAARGHDNDGQHVGVGLGGAAVPAPTASTTAAMTTRARKVVIDAINLEEKRISDLLQRVETTLVELKYETNLLPKDDLSFSRLRNLQSLSITPQPLYPDSMDRESMVQVATFTLPLPQEIFLPALQQFSHLTQLELWRCSFALFPKLLGDAHTAPTFRLSRMGIEECVLREHDLPWLLASTIKARTLENLQISFPTEQPSSSEAGSLAKDIKAILMETGPHLLDLKLELDEGELDDMEADNEVEVEKMSVLRHLGSLRRLHLSGRAITEQHWKAIPHHTMESLQYLALHFAPKLTPTLVIEKLRDIDPGQCNLKEVFMKGSEDFRRRNLRELIKPEALDEKSEWLWTRDDFVFFVSLASARGIVYTADRTISVGDGDDEDASSSVDEYALEEADETGEFVVTQEQWDMEKAIEQEELERTFESGSEY